MKLSYTNSDNDYLIKYTYQEMNNKKFSTKIENQKRLYILGALLLFLYAIYNLVLLYSGRNTNINNTLYNDILLLVGALAMLSFAYIVKPYKENEIKRKIKKGIEASNHVYKLTTISTDDHKFSWESEISSGTIYANPNTKNIFAVEDDNYFFVSGVKDLDLVIPKNVMNEEEMKELRYCLRLDES